MNLKVDFIHLGIATPFPGTEMYRLGFERGIYKSDYWKEFSGNPAEDFIPEVWSEYFNRDELFEIVMKIYKKFYGRPMYILSSLAKIRSIRELMIKVMAGIKVVFR